MEHLIDADYSQQFLFPPAIEDWVGPEHPARFIREFVEALDLEQMEICWADGVGGRPAYAAKLLLKIWLYGYFEKIRSTRKLEAACKNHLGFIWLAGMHAPDHNTLSAFFRRNKRSIREIFKKTVKIAVDADLVGFALHALDGTKIRAKVATRSGWSKEKLERQLARLDEQLKAYEQALEQEDRTNAPSNELPEDLQDRAALRNSVQEALERLKEAERKHMHPQDEDAPVMKCKDENRNAFAYNGQAVLDEKERLLVACEAATDCNDEQQLNAMLDKVDEQAGQCAARTVADTGYATGPEFQKVEQRQCEVAVALPQRMRPDPEHPYAASNFVYDKERDVCICPHGQSLPFMGEHYRKERNYTQRRYRCPATACPYQAQCTKNKHGRTVTITEYYDVIERQRQRQATDEAKADLAKRGYLIESVFAFIKEQLGFRRFTVSGLEGVRAQWSLLCATYNLHKLYAHWRSGHLTLNSGPTGPEPDGTSPNNPGNSPNPALRAPRCVIGTDFWPIRVEFGPFNNPPKPESRFAEAV